MTHDVRVNVTRIGIILGALVAFVVLASAFRGWLREEYVMRGEYQQDIGQIKADVRVLRCELVKDCGVLK